MLAGTKRVMSPVDADEEFSSRSQMIDTEDCKPTNGVKVAFCELLTEIMRRSLATSLRTELQHRDGQAKKENQANIYPMAGGRAGA